MVGFTTLLGHFGTTAQMSISAAENGGFVVRVMLSLQDGERRSGDDQLTIEDSVYNLDQLTI
jgi:hypothetical protein